MYKILENMQNNPYAWGILAILTIVSIIYAVITNRANKKVKKLVYDGYSYNIVRLTDMEIGDLNIVYDGENVNDITITKIVLWNSGNEFIEEKDFSSINSLSVKGDEKCNILNASILVESDSIVDLI